MALLISGHPRSGTTLLYNLCNRHPEIAVMVEFNNFGWIDIPFRVYFKHILRQTWKEKNRSFLIQGAEGNYLEPDTRYGKAHVEVIKDEITKCPRKPWPRRQRAKTLNRR